MRMNCLIHEMSYNFLKAKKIRHQIACYNLFKSLDDVVIQQGMPLWIWENNQTCLYPKFPSIEARSIMLNISRYTRHALFFSISMDLLISAKPEFTNISTVNVYPSVTKKENVKTDIISQTHHHLVLNSQTSLFMLMSFEWTSGRIRTLPCRYVCNKLS